jgi:hypothetical protein
MQIATVADALTALDELTGDIADTAASVSATLAGSNTITGLAGGNLVASQAASNLQQLSNRAAQIAAGLIAASPDDPLTDLQLAQMQQLQEQVIGTRKLIGQAISSVDWTFGDLATDSVNTAVNLGSQAVAAVASATGLDWTWVKIGLAVGAGAALFYAGWRVFR